MQVVRLNKICKTYENGKVLAVNDVSFDVQQGELFGLIGPDGAGKTSIFRILATLLLSDTGSASMAGFDVVKEYRQIRNRIGYMPGKFSLYQDLTISENLTFFAAVFGTTVEENYDLIQSIYEPIAPFKNRRAGKLSGGMKQKLALCCALIHRPEILLLDEPTTGVDAISRKEFWETLKKLQRKGITILVSTPYMDEAMLCDRIALIQKGTILSVDTPENIVKAFPLTLYALKSDNIYALLQDMRTFPEMESCYPFGEYLHVTLKEHTANAAQHLKTFMERKQHQNIEVKTIVPGIEDSFIRLMQGDGNNALRSTN